MRFLFEKAIFVMLTITFSVMRAKNNYERPETEVLDLKPMLDVCNDPSYTGNTDSFGTTTSNSGWEEEFTGN